MPLNYTLKNGYDGTFYIMSILPQSKKRNTEPCENVHNRVKEKADNSFSFKNIPMNKMERESWIHGTDRQLSEGRGEWMKESERIGQRTYMHDPWTHTIV